MTVRRRIAVGLLVVAGLTGGALALTRSGSSETEGPERDAQRPNVVVITTDDQTIESMRVMTATRELVGDAGVTFTRSYASYPLCCPSRATFLTGQYAHNHGVRDNVPPAGGYYALDPNETLPVWMSRAGYRTIHIGKYLNQYGKDGPPTVPPGWDDWFGLIDPFTFRYFGYSASDNGRVVNFGRDATDYQTDVLADRAVQTILEVAGDGPFFMWFAPLAPHVDGQLGATIGAPVPAPRHAGAFADEPLPRPPSFDEEDVTDKPSFIQDLEPLSDEDVERLTEGYRAELETLLAVDEAVARIVAALDRTGELDRTVIMFTSDNGFAHGEHRIRTDKTVLYDPVARVPLLIRGPGFQAGRSVGIPVTNVDLAPTIVAIAGATAGRVTDGLDLREIVATPGLYSDRAVLLENENGGPRPQSVGVVTRDWFFAEHSTGDVELYPRRDIHQLENLAADPDQGLVRLDLRQRLDRLRECAGASCS